MKNLKLEVRYHGGAYFGFEDNNKHRSIEKELIKALVLLLKEEVVLNGASRTDRGVHALCQVVNLKTTSSMPLSTLQRALNGTLPSSIKILSIEEVDQDFHATLDAKGKEYHYRIDTSLFPSPFLRDTAWHVPKPLDLSLMKASAQNLVGTHDFTALCNQRKGIEDKDKVRTVYSIDLKKEGKLLLIVMRGNSFLYKMARNIAGLLVATGKKEIDPEEVPTLLVSKDRKHPFVTAPAHGLFLVHVFYTDCHNF